MISRKFKKGFTLVELLVVIGIITIIASVVFVTLEPGKRLGDARNAKRWSESTSILNALIKYQIDNNGSLPGSSTDGTTYVIANATGSVSPAGACTASSTGASTKIDFRALVPRYLARLPVDPTATDEAQTLYYFERQYGGVLKVGACITDNTASISVAR